jgi:transcriptional regulator with XRE-family HTH domain
MSTSFYKSSTALSVNPAIHFVVQDLQGLAAYVSEKMQRQNLSLHDVAKRSGRRISHATVANVVNATSKEVKASTLAGLAKGLGVSEDEIVAVARGKANQPMTLERFVSELQSLGVEDFNPAKGMKSLTPADMEEILAVVRATVKTMIEQKTKKK